MGQPRLCPHCGAPLPEGAYYEQLNATPGRLPAFVVRHRLPGGRVCVGYAGPECETQESGEGQPLAAALADGN